MDPSLIKQALDAIEKGDAKTALEILKGLIASAAGAEPEPDPSEGDGSQGDGADGQPAPQAMAAEPPPPPDGKAEEKAAIMAATSRLVRLTGTDTIAAAVDEVEAWRQSHIEVTHRKGNAKKLIQLGAETPHTSGLADGKLAKRLLDEPLSEQNARVAALLAAKGGRLPAAATPPAQGGADVHGLSAYELQICKDTNCEPATFAMLKSRRTHKPGDGK
jgi:hypothetical protein